MHIIRALVLLLLVCCSCQKKVEKPPEKPVGVKTYVVELQTIPVDFQFVGTAQSSHLVEIWPRVEGYLEKIAYVEGSFVKEGDVLFQIDPREFQAAVDGAKADLEKEQAALTDAQQAVDRFRPLFALKAASRKDLDDSIAQQLSEEAAVAGFQAKLKQAELNLSYATIVTPISGLTTNSKFREGTLINPASNNSLTTVSVVDPIWVLIAISDYYFLSATEDVEKGVLKIPDNYRFDVTVSLADGTKFPYMGKVDFISPVFDPTTGTLSARAVFPNPEYTLKPGQFVRVTASGATRPNSIAVPQTAVQQGPGSMIVYVVNDQSRAEIRSVEVGDWYKTAWVIKSGLKAGDVVIIEGVNEVQEGTLVKILNTAKAK